MVRTIRLRPAVAVLVGLFWMVAGRGSEAPPAAGRCVVVEVFAHEGDAGEEAVAAAIERFAADRGAVTVVRRFLDASAEDRESLERLSGRHGFDVGQTPVVHACDRVVVGARDPEAIVKSLQAALDVEVFVRPGCARCRAAKEWLPVFQARYPALRVVLLDLAADSGARTLLSELVRRHRTAAASVPVFHVCNRLVVGFDRPETSGPRLEAVLADWTRPCARSIGAEEVPIETVPGEDCIDLPVFGRVDPATLGMPLFTLAIGLVDGFNPCAMWVLLLLLSILVNLRSRARILAVAGTFVAVSGIAYFAFMAAWLNVFEWIGYLRPVQLALGTLAVVIGCVHVKDFFAFHRGVSLSIPEAAKPGIYARIRRIVSAENLPAAIAGAFTLAVLVNVVELLCTAGLPALYTSVLSRQGCSTAGRYGYLGLYIAAYMFDDALMVAGVTATLSRCRLEETGGRWLKLVSGCVVLALGLVMLLRPEWLE
jgi:hypothetical protein